MSVTRWPWADHLKRKEAGEIGRIEAEIKWERRQPVLIGSEIDALLRERQRIQNRATARAKLEHKRGGRKPRAYTWSGS